MRIILCDDCQTDMDTNIKALERIQEKWDTNLNITQVNSGESLCQKLKTEFYDVILLDILMEGMDGIETRDALRALNIEIPIIFISSYDKRMKELFGRQVMAFLDKPVDMMQLEQALQLVISDIDKDKEKVFMFTIQQQERFAFVNEILYFESKGNQIKLVTTQGEYIFVERLKYVWARVEKYKEFVKPSKPYIVNLKYASILNSKEIEIRGQIINIGRAYKDETLTRYKKFLRDRI